MSAWLSVWCEICFRLLARLALLTVSGCALVVLVLFAFMRHKRNRTIGHLKKFPGTYERIPLLRNLVGHRNFLNAARETGVLYGVHMFHAANGIVARYQQHKQGAVVEYVAGLPTVFIFKASLVEEMLTSSGNISKSFGYSFLEPWLGNGLLLSTGGRWRTQRKMLTPAFHFRILDEFSLAMNAQSRIFVERLARKPPTDDIVPYLSALTLDIACETIMGSSMHCQTSDSGLKYLAGIHRLGELFLQRAQYPLLWNDFVFSLTETGREFNRILKVVHGFTLKVIEERKAELLSNPHLLSEAAERANAESEGFVKSKKPFLDMMLQKHLNGELSVDDMRSQVDTFMFAGHDTTSMALTYVIYLIGCHPEVQHKLHDEIDRVFAGDSPDCDVTAEHIRELKYMEMVLKEAQRVLPAVPIIGRHLDEDMIIDGKTVPKGSDVTLMIYGLHRDPDVFPKPEEFIPERFSLEESKNRNPFAFAPFSAGPRNCIGQRFAVLEEKIVLAWLLRRFKWKSLEHRDEIEFVYEIVMRPRSKIRIVFRERD